VHSFIAGMNTGNPVFPRKNVRTFSGQSETTCGTIVPFNTAS
jgi:hypothetical protein